MKQWLGMACALALLSACASRPATGPGSGAGDSYVPLVAPHSVAADVYEADVAACQKTARSYTFVPPNDHVEALFLLKLGTYGASVSRPLGVPAKLATTGVTYGLWQGFEQLVFSPHRADFRDRQETAIANCMARKGYINADPSVAVTWTPTPAAAAKNLRRTGVDTYNAERVAKAQRCTATPFANLVAKGPGFEHYTVPCVNGQLLAVRCTFGNCRPG